MRSPPWSMTVNRTCGWRRLSKKRFSAATTEEFAGQHRNRSVEETKREAAETAVRAAEQSLAVVTARLGEAEKSRTSAKEAFAR